MYVWIPMECHGHVPLCAYPVSVCKWRLPHASSASFPRTPPRPKGNAFNATTVKIYDNTESNLRRSGYTVTMCSLLPRESILWSDVCLCVTSIRTHYDQKHYGYKHRVIRRISLSKWISKSRRTVNIRDLILFYTNMNQLVKKWNMFIKHSSHACTVTRKTMREPIAMISYLSVWIGW